MKRRQEYDDNSKEVIETSMETLTCVEALHHIELRQKSFPKYSLTTKNSTCAFVDLCWMVLVMLCVCLCVLVVTPGEDERAMIDCRMTDQIAISIQVYM